MRRTHAHGRVFGASAVVAAFAIIFTSPVALGARGAGGANPVDEVLDAINSPAGQQWAAQFLRSGESARQDPDPAGDFEHSTGEQPGHTPDRIDILGTSAVEVDFDETRLRDLFVDIDAGYADNGLPLSTFAPQEPRDPNEVIDEQFAWIGVTTAGPWQTDSPGRCETVLWARLPGNPNTFEALPQFPGDPADGTNTAFGLRTDPASNGTPPSAYTFRLDFDGSQFVPGPTGTHAVISPDGLTTNLVVPMDEFSGTDLLTPYTFCVREGFSFAPEDTGSDKIDKLSFGPLPTMTISFGDPFEPPPATDPPVTTPTTVTPTTPTTSTPGDGGDTGDLFLKAFFVGMGAAAVATGVAVKRRRDQAIAPCSCSMTVVIEAPNFIEICCDTALSMTTRPTEDIGRDDGLTADGEAPPPTIPKDPSRVHLDLDLAEQRWDFFDTMVQATIRPNCRGGEVVVDEATYDWTFTQADGVITISVRVEAPVSCPGAGEHPPIHASAEKVIQLREGSCRIGILIEDNAQNEISHVDTILQCGSYQEVFGYFPEGSRTFANTIGGAPGFVNRTSGADIGKPKQWSDAAGNTETLTSEISNMVGSRDGLERFVGQTKTKVYWFTPDGCSACTQMREHWESLAANPGTYYLMNNNCATNAQAGLRAAGLWGDDPWTTVRPGQIENMLDIRQFTGTSGYTIVETDLP